MFREKKKMKSELISTKTTPADECGLHLYLLYVPCALCGSLVDTIVSNAFYFSGNFFSILDLSRRLPVDGGEKDILLFICGHFYFSHSFEYAACVFIFIFFSSLFCCVVHKYLLRSKRAECERTRLCCCRCRCRCASVTHMLNAQYAKVERASPNPISK